eukprot:6184492-Pleurochrysis_carterae.AAC.2
MLRSRLSRAPRLARVPQSSDKSFSASGKTGSDSLKEIKDIKDRPSGLEADLTPVCAEASRVSRRAAAKKAPMFRARAAT